jgi:hypothetical protein
VQRFDSALQLDRLDALVGGHNNGADTRIGRGCQEVIETALVKRLRRRRVIR